MRWCFFENLGADVFSMFVWGNNASGQLGTGDVINRSSPVQLSGLWLQPASISNLACAVKGGALFMWGLGSSGQLGLADTVNRSSPVQVLADLPVDAAVGNTVSGFIKSDGSLWMTGDNSNGNLAQNDTTNRSSFVQVGASTDWAKLSVGVAHCAAINNAGTLYVWGYNGFGELGQNNTISRSSPVQIAGTWTDVVAGSFVTVALKSDGTLWAFGSGSGGMLGDNSTVSKSSPVQIGSENDWTALSTYGGFGTSVAALRGTSLFVWGSNNGGQLGQNDTVNRSSPVQVGGTWSFASMGETHMAAITNTGAVFVCGSNNSGQLGLGDTVSRSSMVQVGSSVGWHNVWCGQASTMVFKN